MTKSCRNSWDYELQCHSFCCERYFNNINSRIKTLLTTKNNFAICQAAYLFYDLLEVLLSYLVFRFLVNTFDKEVD